MLTGKGNLYEELLFPSTPAFEGTIAELLSELEYTGDVFSTTLCTSVNWTGFTGESRVTVLSEKKMVRFTFLTASSPGWVHSDIENIEGFQRQQFVSSWVG